MVVIFLPDARSVWSRMSRSDSANLISTTTVHPEERGMVGVSGRRGGMSLIVTPCLLW